MLARVSPDEVVKAMLRELEKDDVSEDVQAVVCDYVYHMPVVLAYCLDQPVSFLLICAAKLSFYSFLFSQPFCRDAAKVLTQGAREQSELATMLRLNLQADVYFLQSLVQDPTAILQEIGLDEVDCVLTLRLNEANRVAYLEGGLKMSQLIQTQPELIYSLNLQVFQ